MYRKNTSINLLIKVAHEITEKYNISEIEELISLARDVRASTLNFDLPASNILEDTVSLCKANNIKFSIIGAMALTVHGQIRDTSDIDILVDKLPPPEKLKDSEYMSRFGFYRGSSTTGTIITLDHRRNGQIEILLANSPIRQFAIDTSEEHSILGIKVPVVSAASLIGLKAVSVVNNPSRKPKDYPDIMSVWVKSKPDLSKVESFLSEEEKKVISTICSGDV